eukprot:GHVQ01005021.1.p1 GENE.GHVQ01005021.1~~GHVQ01005021.1.p1  ORF type:complete len:964 (+),score=78.15 GHVQ01005021.1:2-2893(+)
MDSLMYSYEVSRYLQQLYSKQMAVKRLRRQQESCSRRSGVKRYRETIDNDVSQPLDSTLTLGSTLCSSTSTSTSTVGPTEPQCNLNDSPKVSSTCLTCRCRRSIGEASINVYSTGTELRSRGFFTDDRENLKQEMREVLVNMLTILKHQIYQLNNHGNNLIFAIGTDLPSVLPPSLPKQEQLSGNENVLVGSETFRWLVHQLQYYYLPQNSVLKKNRCNVENSGNAELNMSSGTMSQQTTAASGGQSTWTHSKFLETNGGTSCSPVFFHHCNSASKLLSSPYYFFPDYPFLFSPLQGADFDAATCAAIRMKTQLTATANKPDSSAVVVAEPDKLFLSASAVVDSSTSPKAMAVPLSFVSTYLNGYEILVYKTFLKARRNNLSLSYLLYTERHQLLQMLHDSILLLCPRLRLCSDALLNAMSQSFTHRFWAAVAERLGSSRKFNGRACQVEWTLNVLPVEHSDVDGSSRMRKWTKEDDALLISTVADLGGRQWREVACIMNCSSGRTVVPSNLVMSSAWSRKSTSEEAHGITSKSQIKPSVTPPRSRTPTVSSRSIAETPTSAFGSGSDSPWLGGYEASSDTPAPRTAFECYKRYIRVLCHNALDKNSESGVWTDSEDRYLLSLVKTSGIDMIPGNSVSVPKFEDSQGDADGESAPSGGSGSFSSVPSFILWSQIGSKLGRGAQHCRIRYLHLVKGATDSVVWTSDEDVRLQFMVAAYGASNWAAVSPNLHNKSAPQCRERYKAIGKASFNTKFQPWLPEENKKLLLGVQLYGPGCWSKIQKLCDIGNRTDRQCCDQWRQLDPIAAVKYDVHRATKKRAFGCRVKRLKNGGPVCKPTELDSSDFPLGGLERLVVEVERAVFAIPLNARSRTKAQLDLSDDETQRDNICKFEKTCRGAGCPAEREKALESVISLHRVLRSISTGDASIDRDLSRSKRFVIRRKEMELDLPKNAYVKGLPADERVL